MNLSVKEIVIGATAITSLGLGVINLIQEKKNKKKISTLAQQLSAVNNTNTVQMPYVPAE